MGVSEAMSSTVKFLVQQLMVEVGQFLDGC